MKAFISIMGFGGDLVILFCPVCHRQIEDKGFELRHPTEEPTGMLGAKSKPVDCPNAGKMFKWPAIELEEIKP